MNHYLQWSIAIGVESKSVVPNRRMVSSERGSLILNRW